MNGMNGMNDALREMIGKKVRVEAEGSGAFVGTLEPADAPWSPWIRLRTDRDKIRCIPLHRLYYIESTE